MEILESVYTDDTVERYDQLNFRWDKLIHIDLRFYIDGIYVLKADVLFSEEILWERGSRSIELIKEFSARFIQENVFKRGKGITLELIECKSC